MDADWGIIEPRDEADEYEQDTWWCDFCQEDAPMFIENDNRPLPDICPMCGHTFIRGATFDLP